MRRKAIILFLAWAVTVGLGFYAGTAVEERAQRERQAERCRTLLVLAADKAETLRSSGEAGTLEALISNVYAARDCAGSAGEGELASALDELWNALIFDGEHLPGQEAALAQALRDQDPAALASAASALRSCDS